jgi:MFS transporter, MHS family, alpha-ketoglutarate permease
MTQQLTASPVQMNVRRQLVAGTIGHGIEFFDFLAYSYLAIYFAPLFFPSSETGLVPMLNAFGVFAVGFLARPFAGLVIGIYADRRGRTRGMQLSITLMATGSLLIAVSPTYEQIGVFAPMLLVLARLLQGISVGGEYTSSSAFLVESAPPGRRGFYSSFMFVSSSAGKLLVLGFIAALTAVLDKEAMTDFGWRIPFAVGALAAVVAWWIRHRTTEPLGTTVSAERVGREHPLAAMRRYPKQAVQVFALVAGVAVGQYFWATYLTTYFTIHNGVTVTTALTIATVTLILYMILQPVAGLFSDRFGRKPSLYVYAIGSAMAVVPLLAIDSADPVLLGFVQFGGLLLLSFATSIMSAVLVELFPPHVRVSGLGFPYSLSVSLFGGTIPLIATALQEAGQVQYLGWYIAGTCVVTLAAALTLQESSTADISSAEVEV